MRGKQPTAERPESALQKILPTYRIYLHSYAAFGGYKYSDIPEEKSLVMVALEWCLNACVERGIEEVHGQEVTFLLSVFREAVTRDSELEALGKEEGHEPSVPPQRGIRLDETLAWHKHFTSSTDPDDQLRRLLSQLYTSWDQMPHLRTGRRWQEALKQAVAHRSSRIYNDVYNKHGAGMEGSGEIHCASPFYTVTNLYTREGCEGLTREEQVEQTLKDLAINNIHWVFYL
jgi:hypothetical protein